MKISLYADSIAIHSNVRKNEITFPILKLHYNIWFKGLIVGFRAWIPLAKFKRLGVHLEVVSIYLPLLHYPYFLLDSQKLILPFQVTRLPLIAPTPS